MSKRILAVGVSVNHEPFTIVVPTQEGIGRASAHVGAVKFSELSTEAKAACLVEQMAMRFDIHAFERHLQHLAESDPNYALWKAEGAQGVPFDAFQGDYSDVEPEEYREGFVGA
jgi:hypothetical protein